MNFTSSFSDNSTILTTTVSYSNPQSSTAVTKDIVKYVELPDWFNDAFNLFNFILAILQFIAFGINLIHMTILTRKELRSNTIYRLMIGICVCDLISQVLSFISFSPFWIRSIKKGEECYVTVTYQDAIINKYVVGVLDDTQRSATWLGLLMALYRVLAVMFPMSPSIQRVSKRAYVPVIVVVVLLLNGMVSSAAMWNHEIYRQLKDFSCDGTQNLLPPDEPRYLTTVPREKTALHNKITLIYGIIKALPSLIEPVLAVLLIIELRRASQRRKTIKKSDGDRNDNTTKLILFVTVSSFLLEVPNGFSHFSFSFFLNSPLIRTIAYLIMCFAEIFPVVNSSTHLFVCFFMSSQYRETAKSMLGRSNQKIIFVEECKTHTITKAASKSL
ncbi:CRE-SRW-2 protein [Caenorhabditis remanei]|uniref:CRE-SRW-2 protein n=1 Tax=Caenorhabditis remanei TaxID=31234 RepID=E3LJL0_CAERE|nr:CRE-SRW-2 protein [Caenorhabditis remanei]